MSNLGLTLSLLFGTVLSVSLTGCDGVRQPVTYSPPSPPMGYRAPRDSRGVYERALSELGERCFAGRTAELALQSQHTLQPVIAPGIESSTGDTALANVRVGPAFSFSFLSQSGTTSSTSASTSQTRPPSPQKLKAVRDLTLLNQLADVEAVRFVKRPRPELILIGPAAEEGQGLQYDDWLTMLRALGQYGPPGVSIDPGPNPDDMIVHYFGGIDDTHLGSVFFEADRTLKLLSTGYDNLNCSKVSLLPAGSPSELELLEQEFAKTRSTPAGWHRFWFDLTKDEVEVSPDNLTARIPSRRLFVDEQAIGPSGASLRSGKAFADQVSNLFLDLGTKIPAFAELQQQAGLWRVAKWIADKQIPIDLRWLEAAPDSVATAKATPTITVARSSIIGSSYLRVGIFGGVDFRRSTAYKPAPDQSELLRASEPTDQARASWDFQYHGRSYRAIRVRYQKPGPLRVASPTWDRPVFEVPPILRYVLNLPTVEEASRELAAGVGRCGSAASHNVVLRGEAYIWYRTTDSVEKTAFGRIAQELRGSDAMKPLTVFVIYNRAQIQVGTYSVSHQPAYRENLDVAVFYWPSGECVGTTRIDGGDPPATRPVQYVPGYGSSVKLADWISGLHRENTR